jgi:uncharacterized phage protein (TIGR01671 family)
MREIKFRAVDKIHNRMCVVIALGFLSNEATCTYTINGLKQHVALKIGEQCELMQYTGLKDKNGKEIYEGDIVKNDWVHKGDLFVVEEGYSMLSWNFAYSGKTWEVIGNIYENPELLK